MFFLLLFVFFPALHVFIWHNLTGRYSWSVHPWDPSKTNKHGRPNPPYADVPRLIHTWICAVFLPQSQAVNLTECMSPSYTQSHMRKQHIHKQWLSKPKDTTETNMSVPRAWAAIIPIEKAVVVWGEKNNNVCLLILTVCADTHRLCVCIITLMLWNLWKWMIHDYDVGQ